MKILVFSYAELKTLLFSWLLILSKIPIYNGVICLIIINMLYLLIELIIHGMSILYLDIDKNLWFRYMIKIWGNFVIVRITWMMLVFYVFYVSGIQILLSDYISQNWGISEICIKLQATGLTIASLKTNCHAQSVQSLQLDQYNMNDTWNNK